MTRWIAEKQGAAIFVSGVKNLYSKLGLSVFNRENALEPGA
jgi:hypothetical protein